MGKKYDFDYIIIGSGPAGTTIAKTLARAKKKVAIVEGKAFGGSNLNSRDIPYAVSLGFSHTFRKLRSYPEIGNGNLHYNFPTIVSHQEYIVSLLGGNSRSAYEDRGITTIVGYAHFLDKNTVAVGELQYTAKTFIIAAGARLRTSEISGLSHVNYLTPDTAIKVRRLPKLAFIIGGGSTGCEIAEYYAELGAKVIIMERATRLLPREDKEVGENLREYFENELGIMVIPNSKVVALEQEGGIKRVIFSAGGQEKMVRVDCVVLATGSEPNTDLGLENAGVKYKKVGIGVNDFFQTSTKNIYAIGDCIGGDSSTERAEYQASVLAQNLLGRSKNLTNYSGFIRVADTYPQVAVVGQNELDLGKSLKKCKKSIVYLKDLPVSRTERLMYGFVKLIADSKNHIIGATIVAPNAALMAEELSIAIRHQLTALEIASTPHISNSFNVAIKLAARKLIKKK